jgi:tripartite-type tricarboxylate transporter receptor subunit TctC
VSVDHRGGCSEVIPNVPTTGEAGLPGFVASTWHAVFAPKGLSPEIQGKLNAALQKALEDEGIKARLTKLGFVVPPASDRTPAALHSLVSSEVTRWSSLLKGPESH